MSEMMISNPENTQLNLASSGTSMEAPVSLESGLRFTNDANEDEDDWCDFNENNRRQYTHTSLLRISQMGLTCTGLGSYESDSGKSEKELKQDTGGDGLGVGSGNQIEDISGSATCPWQKTELATANSKVAMEIEMTKEKLVASSSKEQIPLDQTLEMEGAKKEIYVPPALRQSQMNFTSGRSNSRSSSSKQSSTMVNKGGRKGQAPDLNSSEFFPALSASKILKRGK